jgi:hypothetical protein
MVKNSTFVPAARTARAPSRAAFSARKGVITEAIKADP